MAHYYTQSGQPAYFQQKSNGKGTRPTTIRDARKQNLLPSVTEILKIIDRPGLNNWRIRRAYEISQDTVIRPDENMKSYIERCEKVASKALMQTADRGSEIHDVIEKYYSGQIVTEDMSLMPWVHNVANYVERLTGILGIVDWIPEKTFSVTMLDDYHIMCNGFGGKVDLHSKKHNIVLDWKTKAWVKDDKKSPKGYQEQAMQLSAYEYGLGMDGARRINIFISRDDPELITHTEWDKSYFDHFKCLLDYWYLTKNL